MGIASRAYLIIFKSRAVHWLAPYLVVFIVLTPSVRAQESNVQLDPAQTKVEFSLGAVLHSVHGTFRLKEGTIRFETSTGKARGSIRVDAMSGESGNDDRDRKMQGEILESGKFTEILFTPTGVKGTLDAHGLSHMDVLGRIRLHGQEHDLTLPVDIQADGRQLQLTTRFIVPYVQWGMKNPSTFILRVSDKVTVDIHAVAHITGPEDPR